MKKEMEMKKIWKVTEVIEFTGWVEAKNGKEAKEYYSMAHADNATTIKFTAKKVSGYGMLK